MSTTENDSGNSTTASYENQRNEETPFVNKLIDENTQLKQQILSLSTELRALKVKPGSAENFTEEIEALSNAIKALRYQSETQTLEAARKKISQTVELHIQNQNDNSDLPQNQQQQQKETRISNLENSMLSETERVALKNQRARVKRSIEENFGTENIDRLVEEELQKRRRQKMSRTLEQDSIARGANVLNNSMTSSSSPTNRSSLLTMMPAAISPVRVPRPNPLPSDAEYKQMIKEEDAVLSAQRDENNRRLMLEEEARNETLESALKNPRDFSVPRAREEQQQLIIANSTPLRSAMVKAQQEAFRLLKRDLEADDADNHTNNVDEQEGGGQRLKTESEIEYKKRTQQRLEALQDLEKYHSAMIQKGNCAAAAISV